MESHPFCCNFTRAGAGEAALGSPVLFLWKPLSCFCGNPCVFAQPGKVGLANSSQQKLPGDPAAVCAPGTSAWCPALRWGRGVAVTPALHLCHCCCHIEGAQALGGQCLLPTVKRPRTQPWTTECLQWIHLPCPLFSVCRVGWVGFSPLEGCDFCCGVVFQGKSPLNLQAVFTGSTAYLGISCVHL